MPKTYTLETLLADYPIQVAMKIHWGEMDAFQHLNNVVYFRYFESARLAMFEELGLTESGLPSKVGPILQATSCRYRAPVTYPDTLHIGVRVSDISFDRFTTEYAAVSERQLVVSAIGEATVVSFDYEAKAKAEMPTLWREKLEALMMRRKE